MKQNFPNAILHVYINNSGYDAWAGCVTGPRLAAPLFFGDLSGLLLQVDALLDEQNFPRAYQKKRVFATANPGGTPIPSIEKSGDYTRVFALHINSRHNASWQGLADWLDDRPAQTFVSELQLLRLLEQELG